MNHLTVQQLSASLDGAVTGPSLELVVRHLSACAECRDRQARLARHDDALRRLLAPEPSEAFLEDLGSRAEEIAVAISRGLPPPAMTTSKPLADDEDPYAPSEPPLLDRPELGRAGQLAKEAGYGRIGLKPTGSTQPPEADPAEAERWMEALERGSPPDPSELAMTLPRPKPAPDGPVFDMPTWIKDRASRPQPPSPPHDAQKLRLVFDPPREPAPGFETVAAREPYRSLEPAERYAAPVPAVPAYAMPEPSSRASSYDDPAELAAARARSTPEPGAYATREQAQSAMQRRHREGVRARGMRAHWWIAGGSVGGLALVILALQLMPVSRDDRDRVASTRSFQMPRLEFVRHDSSAVPDPGSGPNELRSASTPAPVETVVPQPTRVVPPGPADSSALAPAGTPADSAGVEKRP